MATTTKTTTRRMARNLREKVSGIANYWNTSREAMDRIEEILHEHGLDLGYMFEAKEASYGSFRYGYEIVSDETGDKIEDTALIFSAYKMPETGHIEVTTYLS